MFRASIPCVIALLLPSLASGQTGPAENSPRLSLSVSGIVSVQPDSNKLQSGPYLDDSLGGNALGGVIALSVRGEEGWTVDLELSSTLSIAEMQDGRLIPGGPLEGRHRDTLVSILHGYRVRTGFGGVECLR